MKETCNIQLPLILTDEKAELMTSILQMLRGEGFAVLSIREDQISSQQLDEKGVKIMDGLTVLRYIREHASKREPVQIVVSENLTDVIKSHHLSTRLAA